MTMSVLSQRDQALLRDLFGRELHDPVKLVFFTQGQSPLHVPGHVCEYCQQEQELLAELSAFSDQVQLEVHDLVAEADLADSRGIAHIPALEVTGQAKGRVRFLGIPSGYEFSALVEDIVDVSRGATKLAAETKAKLAALTRPVHIQVLTTPT